MFLLLYLELHSWPSNSTHLDFLSSILFCYTYAHAHIKSVSSKWCVEHLIRKTTKLTQRHISLSSLLLLNDSNVISAHLFIADLLISHYLIQVSYCYAVNATLLSCVLYCYCIDCTITYLVLMVELLLI
jgi:hypothetical protein